MPTPIIQVPTHTFLGIIADKITVTFQSGNTSHITPREMYNRPTSYSIFDLLYNLVNHVKFARQKDAKDRVTKVTIHLHPHVKCDDAPTNTIDLVPKPIAMTEYTIRYSINDEFTMYTYEIYDTNTKDTSHPPLQFSTFFDSEHGKPVCGFSDTDTDRLDHLKELGRIPQDIDTTTVTTVATSAHQ